MSPIDLIYLRGADVLPTQECGEGFAQEAGRAGGAEGEDGEVRLPRGRAKDFCEDDGADGGEGGGGGGGAGDGERWGSCGGAFWRWWGRGYDACYAGDEGGGVDVGAGARQVFGAWAQGLAWEGEGW
ncbi:hypothetical protein LTR50_006785 [Elasticomyces elasticus]|nr:hypothetical protein LTR50_006785 [Elasticomyces elasticus]